MGPALVLSEEIDVDALKQSTAFTQILPESQILNAFDQ